ncbi:glycosyltransferase [Natronosalvus halobius]|uniref:glycosyltransferase n=1 Tax=Natronosalvus halobius TaxID=2953746 RepID=UPI00209EF73F|nr:glycosyltransferase [Natronosalvus halobius]USZ71458.1 glycosyltransferase [Natronosalvus halobius]
MKIGVMPVVYPNTSKTFITDQVTGMIDRGHSVSIFPARPSRDSVLHGELEEYQLDQYITYTGPPDSLLLAGLGLPRTLLTLLEKYPPCLGSFFDLAFRQGPMIAGKFAYQAPPILDADLDVLHAHFGQSGRIGAKLYKNGEFDAFVTSFHGVGLREGEERGSEIYHELFESCDQLLANSEFAREKLIKFGAERDQVIVHHVGIDTEKFRAKKRDPDPDRITILTVARIHEVKGHEYGIRAIEELATRVPDVEIEYRIVGDGPKRAQLERLIAERQLGSIVTLCGAKNQEEVVLELQNADVFLLPSVREGFGKVLLEAQACSLPVVASNVGGIPEAVESGRSAILVPPRDPYRIAAGLERLVRNPSRRLVMGDAGREHVERNFDKEILNDRLVEIYREAIRGRSPQSITSRYS